MKESAPKFNRSSLVSVILFHCNALTIFQKLILLISILGLIHACYGIYEAVVSSTNILLLSIEIVTVGFIGQKFSSPYLRHRNINIRRSHDVTSLHETISAPQADISHGFKVTSLPARRDSILWSKDVNNHLIKNIHTIKLDIENSLFEDLLIKIRSNLNFYVSILVKKRFEASRNNKMFFNDDKISLGSSINSTSTSVKVFKSNYYTSFLTNDLSTMDVELIERNDDTPKDLWFGINEFPVSKGRRTGGENRLNTIEGSLLSNHIGGNTIAISSDNHMILWRQGTTAQRSEGLLAPTGSGSLDYTDYERLGQNKNLGDMIINGMNRELLEESHKTDTEITDFVKKTIVIGYYRWIGKAGLPGFFGVTKLSANSHDLKANRAEVTRIKESLPVENIAQLTKQIDMLIESPHHLSVPLHGNLLALKHICKKAPHEIDFIFNKSE